MLEIYDSANKLVRRFASDDKPLNVDMTKVNPPDYWVRPFQPLKNEPGMQRFTWDLLYPNPPADRYDLPISAIYKDTPFTPQGPAVLPGKYTVKLTANGKTQTQVLTVRMDPRVTASPADLQQQFDLSMQAYEGVKQTWAMMEEIKKMQTTLKLAKQEAGKNGELIIKIETLEKDISNLLGANQRGTVAVSEMPLGRLGGAFLGLLDLLQDADTKPTSQAVSAAKDLQTALAKSGHAI